MFKVKTESEKINSKKKELDFKLAIFGLKKKSQIFPKDRVVLLGKKRIFLLKQFWVGLVWSLQKSQIHTPKHVWGFIGNLSL